jgi:hypothetical protein
MNTAAESMPMCREPTRKTGVHGFRLSLRSAGMTDDKMAERRRTPICDGYPSRGGYERLAALPFLRRHV